MRSLWVILVGTVGLCSLGTLQAEDLPPCEEDVCGRDACAVAPCAEKPGPLLWASAEYLLWWTKSASMVPLASRNDDPSSIAALNERGTRILIGGPNDPIDFGSFSGLRTVLGCWVVPDTVALEGTMFWLQRADVAFSDSASGGTGPVLAIPFNSTVPFNGNPAGETSLNPGGAPSRVDLGMHSRLWGAEAAVLVNLLTTERFRLHGLTGFQYLDLDESLSLTSTFSDPATRGTLAVRDDFSTLNQFYGGLLGLRAGGSAGPVSLDVTGKVALGGTHQQSAVRGTTTVRGGAFGVASGVTPAGIFAQPSNSGLASRDALTVVPQAQGRLSYAPWEFLAVWVAYDFLYSNNVLRAPTQIDRNVNPTQNNIFLAPGGPPAPLPTFARTDYWAQGISFGMQMRF